MKLRLLAAFVITALFFGACGVRRVSVPVSTRPTSEEANCLTTLDRAAKVNAGYRHRVKGTFYKVAVRKTTGNHYEECFAAVEKIGLANAENRRTIEAHR